MQITLHRVNLCSISSSYVQIGEWNLCRKSVNIKGPFFNHIISDAKRKRPYACDDQNAVFITGMSIRRRELMGYGPGSGCIELREIASLGL